MGLSCGCSGSVVLSGWEAGCVTRPVAREQALTGREELHEPEAPQAPGLSMQVGVKRVQME